MRTIRLAATSTALGAGLLLSGLGLGAAGAASVEPLLVEGNPTCADVAPGTIELKLDFAPADGHYTDGTLTVDIVNSGPSQIDWTSNIDVAAVLMKGGPVANAYLYPGATDLADTGLVTATNLMNETPYGISHVSFCYEVDEPEIPEEEPEIPEEEPEIPEEEPEIPEEEPEIPEEEPETPADEPEVEVLGTQVTPGGAELPRTGAGTLVLAGFGAGLTGLGEVLRRLGRR